MFKASIHIGRTVLANALRMASDRVRPKEERSEVLDTLIREEAREVAKKSLGNAVMLSPIAEQMIDDGMSTHECAPAREDEDEIKPLPGSLAWRAKYGARR